MLELVRGHPAQAFLLFHSKRPASQPLTVGQAMKKIPLGKSGKFALVDDQDYPELSRFKWHLHIAGYAVRKKRVNGKSPTCYMLSLGSYDCEIQAAKAYDKKAT